MTLDPELIFGLGSNLGDSLSMLRAAVRMLTHTLDGSRCSSVYRTPPEGETVQRDFLNAVVRGTAAMTPRQALDLARRLEAEAGRRRPYPGAPRTLDVDVLFVGDAVLDEPDLTLPHPRWATRGFVLVPLLEIAPDWRDPKSHRTVEEIAGCSGWSLGDYPVVASPASLMNLGAA